MNLNNFNLNFHRLSNLNRTQAAVLVGAGSLMVGAAVLRLAFTGISFTNLAITAGLLVIDGGAGLKVHSVAKRRQIRQQEAHDHAIKLKELNAVERQCEAVREEQKRTEQALAEAEAKLELRRMLDFDLDKRKWGAAMALSGYRAGINMNKGATRPERITS